MRKESTATGGVGFTGLLAVAFVVLKLVGAIGWPWWWVLSPLWMPVAFVLVVFAVARLVSAFRN